MKGTESVTSFRIIFGNFDFFVIFALHIHTFFVSTDKEQKQLPFPEVRHELKLRSEFTVDIPPCKEYTKINIAVEGVAYVCKGELCSMKNMSFIFLVNYKDEGDETIKLSLNHDI